MCIRDRDKRIIQLVNQVKKHLIERYGDKIREIILYGSYARGEATKDSDIDLLVLIDDSINPSDVRRSLSDLLFDILLEKENSFQLLFFLRPSLKIIIIHL